MANVVVVGSQWGDEGKGKIVDWLSERADVVVRLDLLLPRALNASPELASPRHAGLLYSARARGTWRAA